MHHNLAKKAANICLNKDWIVFEQYDWCIYAFERRINAIPMFALALCIAVLTRKTAEVLSFLGSFIMLRRRIGGWHSKRAWGCQIISITVILLALFLIGPNIETLDLQQIVLLDTLIILVCAAIRPIYPLQLHFTDEVIAANNKKKHYVLFVIVLIQMLSCILKKYVILIYSFLGMSVALVALVAEWINHYRKSSGMKSRGE